MKTAPPISSVTVCICTRNRPDSLDETLASVARSTVLPHDVVVADDSTDDRTVALVRERYPHVILRQGPRRGLGANRNAAVQAVSTEHILFLDDDCRLDPEFLLISLAALHSEPEPERTIVTGRETNQGRLIAPGDQTFLGFQSRQYRPGDVLHSVVINATLFPRTMFNHLSFDEQLVYGYDEVDLTSRAVAMGYRIKACPGAVNHHYPSPVNRDYYGTHANSARLYVTYKRYRWTERRPGKAATFLVLAIPHLFASLTKAFGLTGVRTAPAVLAEALGSIRQAARTT